MRGPKRGFGAILVHVAGSVVILGSCLTSAYYLSDMAFRHFHWNPPGALALCINVVLAMAVMSAFMQLQFKLFGHRRRHPFEPITEALQRIAAGDFSIRLNRDAVMRGGAGELVQSINDMAGKLDEMEKLRQQFISDVSHEIQSPLTSIRGFACALQKDDLSSTQRQHYLEVIEAESVRLSRLSANLLKLTTLEGDQAKLEAKPYRVDTQIRNLILACESQWGGKQLDMDVDLPELTITADEDLMSQVWSNLIHNAIKFTTAGGSVHIALKRRGDRIAVSVRDSGIGIAGVDQTRIFERFYKASRARSSAEGGSGLGLAIAKRVVDMHRGAISVQSNAGEGAEFTVELPV